MNSIIDEKIHYWSTLLHRGQSDLVSESFHDDMNEDDRSDLEGHLKLIETFVKDLKHLQSP
ncbi:hypothetical protein [Bacillus taeanensis]|uniref:Uncharacterized protein n=1 Tax=Bacillus taeanensis TaxID=273032 RepID=A0A366XUE6_9BACI|nr:hypothetical protein [Bacillus taeanensis]RBW69188.1 hypothetical protein DS031_12440 [Bacillus taeanensis]